MKLVELLAREMNKWPEDCTCGYCMQANESTQVFFGGPAMSVFLSELADDRDTAKVTTAQWQAERDRQKGGEWKRHRGNSQPVDEGTWAEVKLRCGDIQQGLANAFLWRHADCDVAANIMKYRVISQPQAEEVEMNKVDPVVAANVEAFNGQWHFGQIDGPIKWRDTVNELDAYIEEFTRERDSLIERLASEGFALIPPVVSVVSEFSGADMSDWRNLKEGDIIECGDEGWSSSFDGVRVTVKDIERVDYTGSLPINGVDDNGDEDWGESYTFIRRP